MAELSIRRATDADLPEILDVSTRALGWDPADPNESFFRWKHLENPAGPSPMWVAVDGERGGIAGFRTMMRWRYQTTAGTALEAVRAVDTATHPDHQRPLLAASAWYALGCTPNRKQTIPLGFVNCQAMETFPHWETYPAALC